MIVASLPHYADHLAGLDVPGVTVVASYSDLVKARKEGASRIVLAQHGIGQSYGGDPNSARHPSYPGGVDNGDVGLFVVPNDHAAGRWRAAYPGAAVAVVGSPRLDTIPVRSIDVLDDHPVVAVSFHWDPHVSMEARSAFAWYWRVLEPLAKRFHVIGHGHPRRTDLPRVYRSLGIEYVRDFDEVCRRADVYVADNTSTLYEFASTARPVVVLNAPWYRTDVSHGLRFWSAAHVGVNVYNPDRLGDMVARALECWPEDVAMREAALDEVYTYRTGGARRATDAIREWAA